MSASIERIIADAIKTIITESGSENVLNVESYDYPKVAMYPVEDANIDGATYVEGSQGHPMLYVILDANDNILKSYRFYYQYPTMPYYTNGYKVVSEVVAQTIISNSSLGGLGAIGN